MTERHALVLNGQILEFRSEGPNVDQSLLAPGKPRLLPVVVERPEYDPADGTLHGPVFDIQNDKVLENWTFEPFSLDHHRSDAMAKLADRRWQAEVGGMNFDGVYIPTDRVTQAIVDRTCKAFEDGDITGTVDFKLSATVWLDIDEVMLKAIKAAGAQHVQACFSRERALAAEIDSAEDPRTVDISTGWPSF
jgi:hypothetical protein